MIYFDNAATTRIKPQITYDAAMNYMRDLGVSPGRGSYSLGIEASRELYRSRCAVGDYFGLSKPERVVFTKNSTEAINLLINGILKKGDHVIMSCYEHNAVLRPVEHLKRQGIIDYDVISRDDLDLSAEEVYKKYVKQNTRLFILTLASNLTGRILYSPSLLKFFHNAGISTFVDASQGAGKIELNMRDSNIDFLAFTGHKDLLALPGVGGLCCESTQKIEALIQGGTGIHGEEFVNPAIFPEGLEAGTLNMPSIESLKSSLDYIKANKEYIHQKEQELISHLMELISEIDGISIYDGDFPRTPTCCFTMDKVATDKVVYFLDQKGICVRGGIHCAILAHQALRTVETGAIRVSMNFNNTIEEVDYFADALREIVGCI